MSKFKPIIMVLLAATLCAMGASAATWVWEDGEFPEADWDIVSWYPPLDLGDSDATLAFTIAHGGNPGTLRAMGVTLGDGPDDGAMIVQLNNNWTLDPSLAGPITGMAGGLDYLKSSGGPSRIGLAVQQDGEIFVHVLNPQAADTTWTTYYDSILTAADFAPIDPNEVGQPDFSQSGSPMTFGFTTGQIKPFDGGLTSFYQLVDNVLLVMTTGPLSAVGQDVVSVLRAPVVSPNPFNPRTVISFEMPADGFASVRVFDLSGRLVRDLAARRFSSGPHSLTWQGDDNGGSIQASGVYLVVLETGAGRVSQRMTLAR